MMQCLGEMATWMPLPGAIPQYCSRYVDPAPGSRRQAGTTGTRAQSPSLRRDLGRELWSSLYGRENDNLVALWINHHHRLRHLPLNIFAVRILRRGRVHLRLRQDRDHHRPADLVALVLDLGGGPNHQVLGFHYWKQVAIKQYPVTVGGALGRFLAFFSTLVQASLLVRRQVEMVAIAAGEAENLAQEHPLKAVRRVFWRILFFYVLGSLAIGVLVSSNNEDLSSDKPGESDPDRPSSPADKIQAPSPPPGSSPSSSPASRASTASSTPSS